MDDCLSPDNSEQLKEQAYLLIKHYALDIINPKYIADFEQQLLLDVGYVQREFNLAVKIQADAYAKNGMAATDLKTAERLGDYSYTVNPNLPSLSGQVVNGLAAKIIETALSRSGYLTSWV